MWTSLIVILDVTMQYPDMAAVLAMAYTWSAATLAVSLLAYDACRCVTWERAGTEEVIWVP